ncbi:DUF3667 domain-containing protein [Flavobacterium sp. BFFFF1]|uniref:DUF3667 domain-containing protein n=1 Tax=Flavobacterium sp. BFFFF1 TaxID=2015557 RepID=UPI0025BFCF37|nr:DUF3667 domain-containing protein [Flavobacterium sp. BFFFF1]
MTHKTCLNCDKELTDQFCAGCGQKADTHRISFKHFIFHDVLHGTFHIERGMLFTATQALTRPGKAALDYIAGKRKRFYNVFYLILILFGVILFLKHFYHELAIAQGGHFEEAPFSDAASRKMDDIMSQKSKIIVLLFVPLAALNSFLLFRKKRLNLSEHCIIAGMMLLGIMSLSAIGHIVFYLYLLTDSDMVADIVDFGTPSLIVLYVGYGYYNAFAATYSRVGVVARIILFFALLCLEAVALLLLLIGFVTDWKFGTVHFSPFS